MKKDDMIMKMGIVHILDSVVGMPVLSDCPIDMGSNLCDFLKAHIEKFTESDDMKVCQFSDESEVMGLIQNCNAENFVQTSRALCEKLYGIMNSNIDIPAADVAVVVFSAEGVDYFGFLKLNYKTSYTHATKATETGENLNDIILQKAILPSAGQKLSEAFLVNLSNGEILLTEKKFEVNGEKKLYFSELFLECHAPMSQKTKLDIVTKAVEQVNKKYYGDEDTRRKLGWIVAAICSPLILTLALICSLLSGSAEHNNSAVLLCFNGGNIPGKTPTEYVAYIEDMRRSFTLLDDAIAAVNDMTENSNSLDGIRAKAVFYALYFGEDIPSRRAHRQFTDCFVTYEERTRTVTAEDGTETEESYTVAIPVTDMVEVYSNIENVLHLQISEEQKSNADSVYNLARYGVAGGSEGWIPGADVPFIGADGFCSPIGSDWERRVTSEFGNRVDPITGKRKGHTGMDLAVPTGTPIRAALGGTVTVSKYNAGGYGYYVCIDHGNGLVTLYGHCSQLLARVGQTVQAGDIIALSGSTGRSTGPHLHFEVRVNGERTNPRAYLPKG